MTVLPEHCRLCILLQTTIANILDFSAPNRAIWLFLLLLLLAVVCCWRFTAIAILIIAIAICYALKHEALDLDSNDIV